MSKSYQKLIHSYQALGLRVGLTHTTIKKAYRNLIKEWHPDLHQQNPTAAEERAKEINAAFSRLKSASAAELKAVKIFHQSSRPSRKPAPRRAKTGARREAKARRKAPPPPPERRVHRPPRTEPRVDPTPAPDHGPGVPPRFSRQGRDVIGEVEISAAEQISGANWKLVLDTCTGCGGWGAAISTPLRACRACDGLGFRRSPSLVGRRSISTCPQCNGHGCHFESYCKTCDGTGGSTVYSAKFSIPSGLRPNFVGVVNGLGHPGIGAGAPGDLYLLIV